METRSDKKKSVKATKAVNELDATAALFIGSLAKNVMEGEPRCFKNLSR